MSQALYIMTEEQIKAFGNQLLEDFLSKMPVIGPAPQVELISPEELCKRMNISIPTQIRLRKKGRLPYLEAGNQIRYDWNKVLETLKK
jgi:hypothetical protein